jgi:Ser/Thr protein kinase RdoA (MazF antagonist)
VSSNVEESGFYVVGELLGHQAGRSFKNAAGEERTDYEVKVLVGMSTETVHFRTESEARAVVGSTQPRALVSLRVVPVVLAAREQGGRWIRWVAARPAA